MTFRRTVRTGLAKLGIRPDIAERCLNHSQPGIIATYDTHHLCRGQARRVNSMADYCSAPLWQVADLVRDRPRPARQRSELGSPTRRQAAVSVEHICLCRAHHASDPNPARSPGASRQRARRALWRRDARPQPSRQAKRRALPGGLPFQLNRRGGGGCKITICDLEAKARPEHQVLTLRVHRARCDHGCYCPQRPGPSR